MKNNLKEKIFIDFLFIFEKEMPHLTEATKRKLCEVLVESSFENYTANSEGIVKQTTTSINELEKHRKQYKDFIDIIQKSSEKLLKTFKEEKFVEKKFDEATRTYYFKSRTTMVEEMVQFLNVLNKLIVTFYKEVYKIEQTSIDYPKISLF
jgi:hypothetical protein